MSKRAQQKMETRRRLLEAAARVFAREGFSARMGDVAAEAGVAHGSVFAHFQSQERLVETVVEAVGGQLAEHSHRLLGECEGLAGLLDGMVTCLIPHEAFVARLVEELHRLPQAARDSWIAVRSVLSLHFAQAMETEFAPAERDKLPPVHALFTMWMGLIQYYLLDRALFAPGRSVLARRGGELCAHYLRLVHGAAGRDILSLQ